MNPSIAITFIIVTFLCDESISVLSPLCPPSHPELDAVTAESAEHMGAGSYLVAACCPSGHKAIYFGNEGVGCCKTVGQKCIFECNCGDGSDPKSSRVPSFIHQVQENNRHVFININDK